MLWNKKVSKFCVSSLFGAGVVDLDFLHPIPLCPGIVVVAARQFVTTINELWFSHWISWNRLEQTLLFVCVSASVDKSFESEKRFALCDHLYNITSTQKH